jgi:hypothetical protein
MVPVPRQGQPAGGLDGNAPPPPQLSPVQLLLGRDALLEVFMRLSPRFVARCAAVCRQARARCARTRIQEPPCCRSLGHAPLPDLTACRRVQWRAVADAPPLWRAACLAVHEWRTAQPGDDASQGATRVERHCERFFAGHWRSMYTLRPRLRTDGLYVSRCVGCRARREQRHVRIVHPGRAGR